MEVKYVYVKKRAEYGKQCIFDDTHPNVEENIFPNSDQMVNYICKNPIDRQVQMSTQFAVHEVQTASTATKTNGMHHTEGGWPKEINYKDEEVVARFRRRVEKDDNWAPRMCQLMQPMERFVLQNNAINIYQHYFDDVKPIELVKSTGLRTVKIYKDPQPTFRAITHLSWSPNHGERLAASYCNARMLGDSKNSQIDSYIWDIHNPNKPLMSLSAAYPSVTIEFNPRDPSMLISGLTSGQVCNWDIRSSNIPITVSHPQLSHKNAANCALWINSKTNSEFFSASREGTIYWWDIRMLRKPVESLIIDLEDPIRANIVRATGVSALQYEPTMGTKFMAGLENGMLVCGTRKGKNPEKMAAKFDCHYGPVVSIDRNPFSNKNFLTVGYWTTKIWAEDTKEGSLISTRHHSSILTGGCWSTSRCSIFYVINNEGIIEVFDVLVGLTTPLTTTRVCEDGLWALAPHEEGKLVAVGTDAGKIYLIESAEALTSNRSNDKALMSAFFERCSRYEKAVDNRLKETRLAQRIIYQEPELSIESSKGKLKAKGAFQKPTRDKDKKLLDDKKKMDKERKKWRSRKSMDVWKFLGDSQLADAEKQYFETIEKEKEKYAKAELMGARDRSEDDVSTAAVQEVTSSKRRKAEDLRGDREALGKNKKGGTRRQHTPRIPTKDKSGKTTKSANPEIVIVTRKRDSTGEKSENGRITQARLFDGVATKINADEVGKSKEIEDAVSAATASVMEEAIEQSKKNITARKNFAGIEEMFLSRLDTQHQANHEKKPCEEVCHPEICCQDQIDSSGDSDDESNVSLLSRVEERKMNALIEEMLAGLPINTLPSQLADLPHYTKTEKKVILKKNYDPPLVLQEALKQAKNKILDDGKEVITLKTLRHTTKRDKRDRKVSQECASKPKLTETASMVSGEEIESLLQTLESNKLFEASRARGEETERRIKDTCEPTIQRFDSKEILDIIQADVRLPKAPKKIPQLIKPKLLDGVEKYPRISAVNIDI